MFLAFLAFNAVLPSQVMVDTILAFLECLKLNTISYSQMLNYLSAIKSFATRLSMDLKPFHDPKISLYLKAIQKSSPTLLKVNNLVDRCLLHQIVQTCDLTYLGYIFKTAYLIAFLVRTSVAKKTCSAQKANTVDKLSRHSRPSDYILYYKG